METRAERREKKRQAARKHQVHGRSLFVRERLLGEGAKRRPRRKARAR